jgi:hypothetical protein
MILILKYIANHSRFFSNKSCTSKSLNELNLFKRRFEQKYPKIN